MTDALFDHGIELSKDALDGMKDALQDAFDDKWDNISADLDSMKELLEAANSLTASSAADVSESLNKLLQFYGISAVNAGISKTYASGTKSVPKNLMALTQERGSEILVTKAGMITPLSRGDGVVPADLTQRIYDMAMGKSMMNVKIPNYSQIGSGIGGLNVTQHYDSLITIEGSADAATVQDLKNMRKELLDDSYVYTTKMLSKGRIRAGGKRTV